MEKKMTRIMSPGEFAAFSFSKEIRGRQNRPEAVPSIMIFWQNSHGAQHPRWTFTAYVPIGSLAKRQGACYSRRAGKDAPVCPVPRPGPEGVGPLPTRRLLGEVAHVATLSNPDAKVQSSWQTLVGAAAAA